MALNQGPATVIHLSQPVIDGGREVITLHLAGKPGGTAIPASADGDEQMIDAAVVEAVIAGRTGLSVAGVRKLSPIDFNIVFFALFGRSQIQAPPVSTNRKDRK